MSAMPAPAARPAPQPRRSWRPPLQVVHSPGRSRGVVAYLLLCAAVLVAALLAALLLNTQMAVTSYQIHDAQVDLNRLEEEEASLREQVERAGSPAQLREQADELGLVPAEDLTFIDLAGRQILGGAPPEGGE